MKKFLLIGLDPEGIDFSAPGVPAGMTAEKLLGTITDAQKHFADQGDHLDNCKVKPDGSAEATVTEQLAHTTYNCILIGGGIEDPKNMEMFERILNSILRHASGIPIGLVHLPKDAPETVARMMSNGSMAPTQHSARAAHVFSLMKQGDDAFNSRDFAAMDAGRHPDMIAHITGSDKPTHGRDAHAAVQQAMFRAFPDAHLHNDPYPIHFGAGDWMTMVCKITGTFTGEMALPDGKTIQGTGKSFEVDFSRAAKWEGELMVEEWVSWDSALMNQQLGIASTEAGSEPTLPSPDTKAASLDTRLFRHSPAYTLDRATAPAMWLVGSLWLIQATGIQTNNRCSFLEQVMPSGLGPPTHRHPVSVEGFYIVEGTMNFHVEGRIVRAEAGTLVHLPRMIPHTFTVESEEARVINWYAPAGNEIQVVSLAHPAEERRRPTMEESATSKNDELNQILSRLYGSVAVTALPFSVPPAEALVVTEPDSWCAGTLKMARAEDGAAFQAFGLEWRLLAAGSETGGDYDLFEVVAAAGAGMPRRIIGADEAIYVLEGSVNLESDRKSVTTGVGAFSYAPAGTLLRWQAAAAARLLVFHFPGGFDGALAGGRGQEALVVAWLESTGTRFIDAMPLTPAIPGAPGGS